MTSVHFLEKGYYLQHQLRDGWMNNKLMNWCNIRIRFSSTLFLFEDIMMSVYFRENGQYLHHQYLLVHQFFVNPRFITRRLCQLK